MNKVLINRVAKRKDENLISPLLKFKGFSLKFNYFSLNKIIAWIFMKINLAQVLFMKVP